METILHLLMKNASPSTEALFGYADCAKDADVETTVLGKRKAEEEADLASTAGRDDITGSTQPAKDNSALPKRETKRTRGSISQEKLNALQVGTTFLIEVRKLAEVKNKSLRLQALAQFLIQRAEVFKQFKAKQKSLPGSVNPMRKSLRIAVHKKAKRS